MIHHGECHEILETYSDDTFTACVCDPPYALNFMGKDWDKALPPVSDWEEILRVCKPGAHLLAFGETRTYHRLACNIEDAGWEIRDCMMWLYGQGMPKSRQLLKPAWEPIVLARKKDKAYLNVDGCRIGTELRFNGPSRPCANRNCFGSYNPTPKAAAGEYVRGRWPANVIHDGSDEVLDEFKCQSERAGVHGAGHQKDNDRPASNTSWFSKPSGDQPHNGMRYGDSGSVARFFYCAKASRGERGEFNNHPTVKPLALMHYLLTLVRQPSGNLILDPYCGSGSTLLAAQQLDLDAVGIDRDSSSIDIAQRRLAEERMDHEG